MSFLPFRFLFCLGVAAAFAAEEVQPGTRPPREVTVRVAPALAEGRRALAAKDGAAVRAAVARAIEALGPWAGNPEKATPHFPPVNRAPFAAERARDWWLQEIARARPGLPWVKNPEGDPRRMEAGLREAAWPVGALARTAQLVPERREELEKLVRAGADWLIARQQPGGVFPFPVGPGLHPREKVGFIVERVIKEHPELVVDGWIAEDGEDGGLQFDHGLCGGALVMAWELTRDERYLAAAKRAGDWALGRPIVANWNYNAFSAGLLARLARATGEEKYLAAAIEKTDIGVLPGQMPAGRWFDPHNACAVYHNILLRELLEVCAALPADHPFRATVREALVRGLDQAAEETLREGYTGTWTDNFARALVVLGENAKWRDALHANLNASGRNGAPTPGFAVVEFLELARSR